MRQSIEQCQTSIGKLAPLADFVPLASLALHLAAEQACFFLYRWRAASRLNGYGVRPAPQSALRIAVAMFGFRRFFSFSLQSITKTQKEEKNITKTLLSSQPEGSVTTRLRSHESTTTPFRGLSPSRTALGLLLRTLLFILCFHVAQTRKS